LHNILPKYNGLDIVGNFVNDYGTDPTVDDDSDVEMEEDPYMVDVDANVDVVHPIEIQPEVQVGYAEKKGLLFMHHKYACNEGNIRWLKHAAVCHPFANRDPYGEPGPWRAGVHIAND
jgi:hypothetical protein